MFASRVRAYSSWHLSGASLKDRLLDLPTNIRLSRKYLPRKVLQLITNIYYNQEFLFKKFLEYGKAYTRCASLGQPLGLNQKH